MFKKIIKQIKHLSQGSSERRHGYNRRGGSSSRRSHGYHRHSSSSSGRRHRRSPMSGSKRYKRKGWGSSS